MDINGGYKWSRNLNELTIKTFGNQALCGL